MTIDLYSEQYRNQEAFACSPTLSTTRTNPDSICSRPKVGVTTSHLNFDNVTDQTTAAMLSTASTSSIQKRRQQHRRQQSLAVPTLAPTLPVTAKRTQPSRNSHRRGLSLDQSLSRLAHATGRQSIQSQAQLQDLITTSDDTTNNKGTRPGSSQARIHQEITNTGHTMDQQHLQQETQQLSIAQPGFLPPNFQTHLQQQVQGHMQAHPQPRPLASKMFTAEQLAELHKKEAERAFNDLQFHVRWYNYEYGANAQAAMAMNLQGITAGATPAMVPTATMSDLTSMQAETAALIQQASQGGIHPLVQSQARNMPTAPQHVPSTWTSPASGQAGHGRSQSFQQADLSSMSAAAGSSPAAFLESIQRQTADLFPISKEDGYASSAYSSSLVDPMSPERPLNHSTALPPLLENPMAATYSIQNNITSDDILLQAVAGSTGNFGTADFLVEATDDQEPGSSPKTALIDNLGPQVNASIIDTGIPMDDIDEHISEQDPVTKLFYCLWKEADGSQCDKWHKRKENARSHVQGHMGDRQFLCNDCGKTFVRQHDMKRHAAIHNPERPHRCPCGSRFARHDALTRHRQRGMCSGTLPGFERRDEDKPKRGRPRKKDRPDELTRTSKAQRARQMDRENAASGDGDMHASGFYASSSASCGASDRSLPITPPDTSDDFDADAFIRMADSNFGADDGNGHSNGIAIFSSNVATRTSTWNDTPPTSPYGDATSVPADLMDMCSSTPLTPSQNQTDGQSNAHGISPTILSQPSSSPPAAHSNAHPSPVSSPITFNGASSPLEGYGFQNNTTDLDTVGTQPDPVEAASSPALAFFSDAFSPTDSSSSECEFLLFGNENRLSNTQQYENGAVTAVNKDIEFFNDDNERFTHGFDSRDDTDASLLHALDAYISSH